jgi:hypothetical protein
VPHGDVFRHGGIHDFGQQGEQVVEAVGRLDVFAADIIRSLVEGDARTERDRGRKVPPGYCGRCVLRVERFDANALRCGRPTCATGALGRRPVLVPREGAAAARTTSL